MPATGSLAVEFRAGASFELLISLFAAEGAAGERWLHLLGLALELPAETARDFVDCLAEVEPLELRRHLVGVHVPAWRTVVGAETLERAARGDKSAFAPLLRSDRYYAGHARESLADLLPLSAAQTKRRLVAAARRFAEESFDAAVVDVLERDAASRRAAGGQPEAVIAAATRGYVYEPEPEFRRVVLIPHVAARPQLLLCQHRDARVICYPAQEPEGDDVLQRAVALGRALGDERRVAMLRRLVEGEASLAELAETVGVAKSTAHHHLGALRAAGLVTLRGNARAYWYSLRLEGLAEARAVLGDVVAP